MPLGLHKEGGGEAGRGSDVAEAVVWEGNGERERKEDEEEEEEEDEEEEEAGGGGWREEERGRERLERDLLSLNKCLSINISATRLFPPLVGAL